jgi:hypothetical protein
MTLWLTLLLIWTTGIPLAVLSGAALATRFQERRVARFVRYSVQLPNRRPILAACERRARPYRLPSRPYQRRRRVEERPPA